MASLTPLTEDVLNPFAVRLGSGEVYNAKPDNHEFEETLCVSRTDLKTNKAVMVFVNMMKTTHRGNDFLDEVDNPFKAYVTLRHVPK